MRECLVPIFSGILGLALASGINLYASVLTLGLGIRCGWLSGLPPQLSVLANPLILAISLTLYGAEFLADEGRFFTPFRNAVHTFIRPLGAAILAAQAGGQLDPVIRTAEVLISGFVALAAHLTKMGVRMTTHAVPDRCTHWAISVGEDMGIVALLVLAWKHPLIALPICLFRLIMIGYLLRIFCGSQKGFSGWFRQRSSSGVEA